MRIHRGSGLGLIVLLLIAGVFLNSAAAQTTQPNPVAGLEPYTAFAWQSSVRLPPHVAPLVWITPDDSTPVVVRRLRNIRPGRRVLFPFHSTEFIWGNPLDRVPGTAFQSPWLVNGAAADAKWSDRLFKAIKSAGLALDFVATDNEVGLSMWTAPQPQINAIAADPRFAPVAKRFGLTDVSHASNFYDWNTSTRWNQAVGSLVASYFRIGIYDPLHQTFPDAGLSDYGSVLLKPQYVNWAPDSNGYIGAQVQPLYGNVQSPSLYGTASALASPDRNDGTHPDFDASPMPTLCWTLNSLRAYRLSSDAPIIPWVATRHFVARWCNTPYYDEAIRHILLASEQTNLLYFNPEPAPQREPDDACMNAILTDVSAALGGSRSFKALTLDRMPLNSSTAVTGVQLPDGRRVFRVTLGKGMTTAKVTLPDETAPIDATPLPGDVGVWITRPALHGVP